jgi:hypothetical protein
MALDICHSFDQQSLAMEPLAGLAQVALGNGDPTSAQAHIEIILSHLANGGNLDGTEEPLRIYLAIYQTLAAKSDPRADQILKEAYSVLQEQVNRIQGQTNREMFVHNVPWRQKIEEFWQQNQETKQQDN